MVSYCGMGSFRRLTLPVLQSRECLESTIRVTWRETSSIAPASITDFCTRTARSPRSMCPGRRRLSDLASTTSARSWDLTSCKASSTVICGPSLESSSPSTFREALPPACAESTTEATALANSRTAPALTRFCWLPASLLRSMCREPPQHSAVASISGAMSQGTSRTPSPTVREGSSPPDGNARKGGQEGGRDDYLNLILKSVESRPPDP